MNITALGNISKSTLSKHIEVDNIEFSFQLSISELNDHMKSKIIKELNSRKQAFSDITAAILYAMPNFNTNKMSFETVIYFPDDRGDEWGNSISIPLHLTDTEFEQFKTNVLARFITDMAQC